MTGTKRYKTPKAETTLKPATRAIHCAKVMVDALEVARTSGEVLFECGGKALLTEEGRALFRQQLAVATKLLVDAEPSLTRGVRAALTDGVELVASQAASDLVRQVGKQAAVKVALRGVAKAAGRTGAVGAAIDAVITAAGEGRRLYNGETTVADAAWRTGKSALIGAASSAAAPVAVAGLVCLVGPMAAPAVAVVGLATSMGSRAALERAFNK